MDNSQEIKQARLNAIVGQVAETGIQSISRRATTRKMKEFIEDSTGDLDDRRITGQDVRCVLEVVNRMARE